MEAEKKLFRWEIAGFIFGTLMTVLIHMLYQWTGGSEWVMPLASVNESIYEHNKLLITPFILFAIVESFFVRDVVDCKKFWATKLGIIALTPLALAMMYYTYSGIIGDNFAVIDIFIGQLLVAIMFAVSYKVLKSDAKLPAPYLWIIAGIAVLALQVVFTYLPPDIAWFIPQSEM